jgi:hypothetical protein
MKKILVGLFILLIIFVISIVVFLLRFDINRYKGFIIEKASQAIQKDIEMGHISLDLWHGFGFRVTDLAVKEKDARWSDALLKAQDVEVSVEILPLLKRDIQVGRIEIRGLELKLNGEFLKQPAIPTAPSGEKVDAGTAALASLKFLARSIIVKDSVVAYTSKDANQIKIGISTLILNNVSLEGPVRVNAVLSTLDKAKDNVIIKAKVFPEIETKTPYIENLDLRLDLAGIDIPGFLRVFGQSQLAEKINYKLLRGTLTASTDKLFFDPKKILELDIKTSLIGFSSDIAMVPGGIKDLNLEASLSGGEVEIKKLSGFVAGGMIDAEGVVKGLRDLIEAGKPPYIKNFSCQLNLADFDFPKLLNSFGYGTLATKIHGKTLKGNVVIKGDRLFLEPAKVFDSIFSISISKLDTDMVPVRGGLEDMDLDAGLENGDIIVKKLSGLVLGGAISAKGTVKNIAGLVSRKAPFEAEDAYIQLNLGDFDISEILEIAGKKDIASKIKGKTITGNVIIKSKKIKKEVPQDLFISISQGMTDIVPIQGSVKDIELEAVLKQVDLIINKLTGSVAGGTFSIMGSIKDVFSTQGSNLEISCRDIDLELVLPKTQPGEPMFQGIVDFEASVSGQGLQQESLIQGLGGSGSLKLSEPVLKNMNILRMAFEKMDMIPGLISKLRENLPENYYEVLRQNDTYFRPIDAIFKIRQGNVLFDKVVVESEGFAIPARGQIGLTGDILIDANLFIAKDISESFIRVIREFSYLQEEHGMVTMPLYIRGKAPNVSVDIDRDYVISKLIVSKGTELLENIFKKKGGEEPAQEQPGSESPNAAQDEEESPSPATLIKSIFDVLNSQNR